MSWSVAAIGKAPAVRKEIAAQFVRGGKCAEPEESLRQGTAQLLDSVLAATHDATVVQVSASGSQSNKGYQHPELGTTHSLSISVVPQYSFVE